MEDSLEVLGGLGAQRDDGVGGERRFDLRGQRVDGETLLLTNVAADRRELPPWARERGERELVSSSPGSRGGGGQTQQLLQPEIREFTAEQSDFHHHCTTPLSGSEPECWK